MKEPKSMQELHRIQEEISNKESHFTSKEKLTAIRRESENVKNKFKLKLKSYKDEVFKKAA